MTEYRFLQSQSIQKKTKDTLSFAPFVQTLSNRYLLSNWYSIWRNNTEIKLLASMFIDVCPKKPHLLRMFSRNDSYSLFIAHIIYNFSRDSKSLASQSNLIQIVLSMKKTRQRASLAKKDASQEAHLTNKVKFALGLASKSRMQKNKPQKTNISTQKMGFSQPKAKSMRRIKRNSNKYVNRQPSQQENDQEQILSQKQIWKMNNEFKEGIINWSNFVLIPNPKSKSKMFLCGQCKCSFLKIVEFTYHCSEICGEIHHIESSHFIIHQHDLSKTLYETLLSEENTKQYQSYGKKSRSKTTEKQLKGRDMKKSRSKVQVGKYLNILERKPEKEAKRQDSVDQIIQSQKDLNRQEDQSQKQSHISESEHNIEDISYFKNQQSDNEDNIETQTQKKANNLSGHLYVKIKPFSKRNEEDFFKDKLQKIKQQSKQILQIFKARYIETQFVINKNYLPLFPYFIFLVNPLQNKVKILKQNSRQCILQHSLQKFIHNHFIERCCKVNTIESLYLILWSKDFYQYLYEKSMSYSRIIYENSQDIAYWKYLYENTPLLQQINMKYPYFKQHLGYIHLFINQKSYIKKCRFCNVILPGDFIKKCLSRAHIHTCPIRVRNFYKKQLFSIQMQDKVKQYTKDMLNIEKVESYTYFCPCQSKELQMNAEELIKHCFSNHKKPYEIDIGVFFKKK